ncbi:hypothetical protein GDO78_020979 [Eleutherodactylus coqui]|uniref:Uncharacterized protein n=1 Tax=Eleutherodactylus coqui TaxID=57060 RepID=A0A8J6JSZ8_ELECQ|nr:hypothetical protein GDO78_020979 [Eleutherodactylus coqui]
MISPRMDTPPMLGSMLCYHQPFRPVTLKASLAAKYRSHLHPRLGRVAFYSPKHCEHILQDGECDALHVSQSQKSCVLLFFFRFLFQRHNQQ